MDLAPDDPRIQKVANLYYTGLVNKIESALDNNQLDQAEALLTFAEDPAMPDKLAKLKLKLTKARSLAKQLALRNEALSKIVPIKIKKQVQPVYPRGAQKRGEEGWVKVGFTVDGNGDTSNVKVLDAAPKNVFDKAAITAVKKWKFEIADNVDPENFKYDANIRVSFTLD